MSRTYLGCLLLFLLMWFLGVALHLPGTQRELATQARILLDDTRHDGVFRNVDVAFSGQEATLTGAVARAEEKILLEKIIREQVRLRDQQPQRNPVISVHNAVVVDPDAAPKRNHVWLLVAIYGSQKRIEGVLKSPGHRLALLEKMEKLVPAADDASRERANQIIVDERAWPAADWEKTLDAMPDFSSLADKNDKRSIIAVTPGDGSWQIFAASATDAEIAAALASARVSEREVAQALNDLRIHQSSASVDTPPQP